jgi:DNA-binding XRE family transcriptional regulator
MIRKHRLDLGIRQIDVAKMIACDEMSIVNWEEGYRSPRVNQMAGVVEFLGFDPYLKGDTMAHRLVNHRQARGMAQKKFAQQIGLGRELGGRRANANWAICNRGRRS